MDFDVDAGVLIDPGGKQTEGTSSVAQNFIIAKDNNYSITLLI